ncbi:MAG: SDR family oxidoreductase [Fuerstiella sp.]|nr:SDR family oxidoreductase [Fuerstiella sp.]MCP4855794.1 SDR family oxidoreductase [Fuerstiella sp.]
MNKNVLITGVSSGIGKQMVNLFRERGWQVLGVDRNESTDCDAFVTVDLCQPDAAGTICDSFSNHLSGGLNAFISNAAMEHFQSVANTTVAQWNAVLAANLNAPFFLAQQLHAPLAKREGSIVNISSVHATATTSNIAAYAASKGGMSAMTRAVALEFACDRIRVNSISPGAIDTPLLREGMARGDLGGRSIEDAIADLSACTPLGRIGNPNEIAETAFFLADNDKSGFITGQDIVVDGGVLSALSSEVSTVFRPGSR